MRLYDNGYWGFGSVFGLEGSVFPQCFIMAFPNAVISYCLSSYLRDSPSLDELRDWTSTFLGLLGTLTSVLFFILQGRSSTAYDRWWEGGTLLQKTRGEWFNSYSSQLAFSSNDPKMLEEVEKYQHFLARVMSLLFSAALQQVSPYPDRVFPLINPEGIDPLSLQYLTEVQDKVEVLLQWLQRSTILMMGSGVIPTAPPVVSRAFQEVSRGIVNLQNARKIADFPYPYPYAQSLMVLLFLHWGICAISSSVLLPPHMAAAVSFGIIFFLWSLHFIAIQLEWPFGDGDNDLPMLPMQDDWNKSVGTLLHDRAKNAPWFKFDCEKHRQLLLVQTDGSGETVPLDLATNRATRRASKVCG